VSDVFTPNLIVAVVLTLVTQAIQIGAYAARYAGVITRRIATAISLFSLLVTASRLASLVTTPMLGTMADFAANHAQRVASGPQSSYLAVAPEALARFDLQMRLIVAGGSVGIVLGAVLLPVFLLMFVRGIRAFERLGSIPAALMRLFDPRVAGDLLKALFHPPPLRWRDFPISAIPRQLLIANTILFGVYSVGVVAAFYASVLDLDARTTAAGLSGLVNGVGTVAFALFIDPTTALIVDQTVRDERPRRDVAAMIFWLIVTALLGTVLAQLILAPAAHYIAIVAEFIINHSKH
jgi:hypothetical protein